MCWRWRYSHPRCLVVATSRLDWVRVSRRKHARTRNGVRVAERTNGQGGGTKNGRDGKHNSRCKSVIHSLDFSFFLSLSVPILVFLLFLCIYL